MVPASTSLTLTFDVCSNPAASRVLWATPIHSLRPGQSRGGEGEVRALPLARSPDNVTCHRASLLLGPPVAPGEYVLVASNRHGAADAAVELRAPDRQSGGFTSGGWSLGSTHSRMLLMALVFACRTLSILQN